jgi:hypothetical protein
MVLKAEELLLWEAGMLFGTYIFWRQLNLNQVSSQTRHKRILYFFCSLRKLYFLFLSFPFIGIFPNEIEFLKIDF